ncbi:hypothetical protein NXW38_07750 [Bacteroides ovatus]|nr:hypothetical protein [Bacteroides ovatus]
MSRKLGFSIGYDVFDYGLVIPHYGTIVVGNTNRIGTIRSIAYIYLHHRYRQEDKYQALSLSTGAKITGGEMLGDHIVVVPILLSPNPFLRAMSCLWGCLPQRRPNCLIGTHR